jgi:hypothetical protein
MPMVAGSRQRRRSCCYRQRNRQDHSLPHVTLLFALVGTSLSMMPLLPGWN